MGKLISMFGISILSLFCFTSLSLAQHNHGHGAAPMKMDTRGRSLKGSRSFFRL
jgi:hypothetical protein